MKVMVAPKSLGLTMTELSINPLREPAKDAIDKVEDAKAIKFSCN